MSKEQNSKSAYNHIEQEEESLDPLNNILSLQLRKPAHWKWELSTSRSCSKIALPRILLYDQTGTLLLDADGQTEQTYRPVNVTERRRKRAATTNLYQSVQQSRLSNEFHALRIVDSPKSCCPGRQQLTGSCIEFSTHELPDWQPREVVASRRSSSLRAVRLEYQEQQEQQQQSQEIAYLTPPSTSTLTTTANSSSSGPREKRRYRRSHSSGQRSILERFSMSRGRLSSPEYVQEELLKHSPRYFLRTSKAGTLVIQDDSFSRVRQRRRRHRLSSSENVLFQKQDTNTAERVIQLTSRRCNQQQEKKSQEQFLSTSEEEIQAQGLDQVQRIRPSRSRHNKQNCGKDAAKQKLIMVDPSKCVHRASCIVTAR